MNLLIIEECIFFRLLPRICKLNFCSKPSDKQQPLKLTESDDVDEPVVYSRTKAYKHLAKHSRYREPNWPASTPYVIMVSFAIFMIYFCILREESDIDQLIDMPLETRLKQLEAQRKAQ